jgi:hypothetical protein
VTYKMSLEEYIEYFESFERNKIYNVLSLEISNSKYVLHLINNWEIYIRSGNRCSKPEFSRKIKMSIEIAAGWGWKQYWNSIPPHAHLCLHSITKHYCNLDRHFYCQRYSGESARSKDSVDDCKCTSGFFNNHV